MKVITSQALHIGVQYKINYPDINRGQYIRHKNALNLFAPHSLPKELSVADATESGRILLL